ncbi:MAG: hypothetical protein J5502_08495 [Prevotella sp.]|nr:hypothetical protein [Prevotella sp.]
MPKNPKTQILFIRFNSLSLHTIIVLLRDQYNERYGDSRNDIPIIINSGYRSEEVNRKCGGSKGSNHLTGCAVDIKCYAPSR